MTALALAMASWWLWQGWYEALAVTAVGGLVIAGQRHRRTVAVRDAGLRARAEYEHRLSLAGDPRGVFGRYPPVQPGWYPDPGAAIGARQNRYQLRYFDGSVWTPHAVSR
nr:DUF2510 domain-containing protein [Mycolicibacterium hippocampi]